MNKLIIEVHNLLIKNKVKISFAESCTGGLLQKLITDTSGSSNYFEGGFVVYSNRLKNKLLGVAEEILQEEGAVSSACAEAMTTGLKEQTNADLCIAVTGIAGPGGGSQDKPVGTVWFSFDFPQEKYRICQHFTGSRQEIREESARFVLKNIREYLKKRL